MTKKLIQLFSFVSIFLTLLIFNACDNSGPKENWISFTSHGQYEGNTKTFRHTFINRSTISVTVRYLNTSVNITRGSERYIIVSGEENNQYFSLNCQVRAEDDRDLEISPYRTIVEFRDGPTKSDDPDDPDTPDVPVDIVDPVDSAFWFGDIYNSLITRIGEVYSDEFDVAASWQFVCDAINAKWGTTFNPESEAAKAADAEYLLSMIDEANDNRTNFKTSGYATKQLVDVTAVNDALNSLWVPGTNFAAIATVSNRAAYSADGINWIAATLPGSTYWYDVCYGGGKFIAIATGSNRAAYSADGINWNESTLPRSSKWHGVCYGNGIFVTVAEGNYAAYSADGINWTESTMPGSAVWHSVCYGNGIFVAIADSGDNAAYSTDGKNWTAATTPDNFGWNSICYGNGKFVAINEDVAAFSTNGIEWTKVTLPSSAGWEEVCYGNGMFAAIAAYSSKVVYSANGINWTEAALPGSAVWNSISYGNGKFVTVAYNSSRAAYSTDCINWTETTLPSSAGWCGICFGGE